MLVPPPQSHQACDRARWAVIVKDCPLFIGLNASIHGILLHSARHRVAAPGEFFFLEGDPPTTVYVLVDGRVRLVRVGPRGRALIVGFVEAGEPFGYVAAWAGTVHRVGAQAAEVSQALVWSVETMTQLTLRYPEIARAGLRVLAARVESGWDRLYDLHTRRTECRVARALLQFSPGANPAAGPETPLDVHLREQDLAELVGVTTFTVSRILSAWRRDGVADVRRAHIVVPAPRRLREIAMVPDRAND